MRRMYSVIDLGFGDAGKGTIVDFLASHFSSSLVVRTNGGAQAGHNVMVQKKSHRTHQDTQTLHHCFSQYGSNSLCDMPSTLMADTALFDPAALRVEYNNLFSKLKTPPVFCVGLNAKVVTPYHKIANKIREGLRVKKHGSCGMGIGELMKQYETTPDLVIHARELNEPEILKKKFGGYREKLLEEFGGLPRPVDGIDQIDIDALKREENVDRLVEHLYTTSLELHSKCFVSTENERSYLSTYGAQAVIFEGAQGVLLDQTYGFNPYTTWSDTTGRTVDDFVSRNLYDMPKSYTPMLRIGVMRTFQTRHGPGPMPTESPTLSKKICDFNNPYNPWQGHFRVGWLDLVLLRYALKLTQIDVLAVTHLDKIAFGETVKVCDAYEIDGEVTKDIHPQMGRNYSEVVGDMVGRAKPIYDEYVFSNQEDFIEFIENAAKVPVRIISSGPLRSDKKILL